MLPSDAAAAHRARRSPGYLLRPLLQHVGLHDVPDVYMSVLHEYMALRKIDEIYTRPAYATAIFMASSHTPRTLPNAHHQTEGRSLRRPDVKQSRLVGTRQGGAAWAAAARLFLFTLAAMPRRAATPLTPPLVPAPARHSTSMSSDLKDSLKHGRYVNVAPHLRLVAEERDCWKPLESAAALEFPRSNGMDQVSNFHRAVARQLATHAYNHDLAADRAAWLEREDAILAPLALYGVARLMQVQHAHAARLALLELARERRAAARRAHQGAAPVRLISAPLAAVAALISIQSLAFTLANAFAPAAVENELRRLGLEPRKGEGRALVEHLRLHRCAVDELLAHLLDSEFGAGMPMRAARAAGVRREGDRAKAAAGDDGRDLELNHADEVLRHVITLWGDEAKLFTIIEEELWEI